MHLFDQGWEKLREQIFANQKRLGVIPANTQLTPWPDDLPKWDSLSAVKKKIVTREADVFAAYVAYNDYEIGRVIQAVQDMGKLDNTLIIYITGDNGTSSEGSMMGAPNNMTVYNGVLELPEIEYIRYYESWGSDATYPHMAVPWAWAFDTPFKWVKQVASHFGGTRQGMVMSWPGHINDLGGIRHQFHHVIDIVPTILDVLGLREEQCLHLLEFVGVLRSEVVGLREVRTDVVELPLVLLDRRQRLRADEPWRLWRRRGGVPAVVVDAAVREHLEVLGLAL
jgi:arylsulfatase